MQKLYFLLGLVSLCALGLSGCSSDDDTPRHHNKDAETVGPVPPPKPIMHGQETFFGGKILIEASLGQGGRHAGKGGDDSGSSDSGGKSGGGHHGHHGGGGGGSGGTGGGQSGGGYLGGGDSTHGLRESSMPPVTLRLHVTNKSDAAIEITFDGCDSTLGNFVVTPEKVALGAGQEVDVDPMRSLLGVTADDIPVELTLRLANHGEKKTVHLVLDQPAQTMPEAPSVTPAATSSGP